MENTQFQRWTARRDAEAFMQLGRRERTLLDVCRKNDFKQSDVAGWVETFQKSGELGLKINSDEESAAREREIKEPVVRSRVATEINRKRIHRIIKTHGWQIRQKPTGSRSKGQGTPVCREPNKRAVGDRLNPRVLWIRRLVPPDGDH